ncbi:MAG: sporulation protein YqfD, partial [Pseudoflavonifractor sp.]
MQKIINFLRGSVGLEITGAFPERYLNLCAQNRVSFWGVERCSGQVLRLTVARQNLRQAYALGERAECAVTETAARGVPAFLVRFRRRYALLAGLACSLLTVCIFSQFVLTVEVTGNVTVPTAQILGELQRAGVRPGVYGPGIDLAEVGQLMPLRMQELSWCAVNLRGTVAEVLVRERVKKPKLADESRLGNVVAEAPGIITKMEVLEGEPSCKPGDTVLAGEVLIAGNIHMEAPAYSNTDLGWRQVQAQGRIYARTWRTLQAKIPMHATVKVPTGAEITRWSGEVLGL